MAEKVFIGNAAKSVETSPAFDTYTGVSITVDGQEKWYSGNANGRILTIENPYGSDAMATAILNQLNTNNYQPLTISGAIHNPAIEIGDAVTTKGVYNGAYSIAKSFGQMMTSTIKAPSDEEVNHEFPAGGSSKYATYRGLLNGTTAVNGAGLTSGSVTNSAIKSKTITGGSIANNAISYGLTSGGVQGSLDSGDSAYATLTTWTSSTGATFQSLKTSYCYISGTLIVGNCQVVVPQSGGNVTATPV